MSVDIYNREPELYDDVKHVNNETAGTVIAKFPGPPVNGKSIWFLDIRTTEDRIWYGSPMKNWKVVRTEEEKL